MRIVIDARELRTTTGRYIERLIHYLQKLDQKNEYLILLKPDDISTWEPTNPNFKVVRCPFKEFTFSEQLGFKRQLDSLNADLVHFGMVQQPIQYKGAVVTTIHDLITARFRNPIKNQLVYAARQTVYKKVIKVATRKSKAIIVPSNFVKQDLIDFTGVNPDKVHVTYEAADPMSDDSKPIKNLVNKDFIVYVGRPFPHKNLRRLIDAFIKLQKDSHPDLKLVLVGREDALYAQHEAYVRGKEIRNIVFAGFVEADSLRWLYENCRAYVFPSLSEGFGLPPLEAMIYGAPVVSSNSSCLPEISGPAAHYFDPLDVNDMAKKIEEVLDDKELRNTLIKNGYAQVKKYSWEKMAKQTLEIYESALNDSSML